MKETFDSLVQHLMDKGFFLEQAVELVERTMISQALSRSRGNQSAASKVLGIHRNTLQRKMVEYQLDGKRVRRKPPARAQATRKRKTG
jgi:DNA-binding NtrC family response regulator